MNFDGEENEQPVQAEEAVAEPVVEAEAPVQE